jgi:glycosyltransferase 2 family protein
VKDNFVVKRWKFWLGLAVSAVFLYLAFRGQDFGQIGSAIQKANYIYLAPALVAYFIGVWVRAVRWRYLLLPIADRSSRRLFPVVVIGYMANDVLPFRMGEIVRAYVLGEREKISKSSTLATIVVERIFDGLTMVLFMVVISLFIPLNEQIQLVIRIGAILFIGVLVLFFVAALWQSRATSLFGRLVGVLPSRVGDKAKEIFDSFLTGLQILRTKQALLAVFGLSILAWLFESLMYYVLSFGFNLNLPFHALTLTTAVANMATLVPSSPGYVGTFEAASLLVLSGVFNVARGLATSYTVVLHTALLLPVTLLGLFYWWRESISWSKVQRADVKPVESFQRAE